MSEETASLTENKPTVTGQSRAVGLFLLKKYRQAAAAYDELLEQQPDNAVFRFNRTLCELQYSPDREALFDKLLAKEPDLPVQADLCLADLSVQAERTDKALSFLNKALEKDADNIDAYVTKAFLLNELDRRQELYELMRRVYPRFKKDERILCLAAFFAALTENGQQSDFLLRRALKANKKACFHDRFFYAALLMRHKSDAMEKYAENALTCGNEDPVLWHALSQAYWDKGKNAQADMAFGKLSRLEPLTDDLKIQWCALLLENREFDRAFDLLCGISERSVKWLWLVRETLERLFQSEDYDKMKEKAEQLRKRFRDSDDVAFFCDAFLNKNRKKPQPLSSVRVEFDDQAENAQIFNFSEFYLAPSLTQQALTACSFSTGKSFDVLDLGCGTGALASVLKTYADPAGTLSGVDLSPVSLEYAARLRAYTDLWETDIVSFCKTGREGRLFDAIVCMDVSPSFADLSDLFKAVSGALKPDGVFVFSIAPLYGEKGPFSFMSGLFSHTPDHAAKALRKAGLIEAWRQEGALYQDEEFEKPCLVFAARKQTV